MKRDSRAMGLRKAAALLRKKLKKKPAVALVLGSGLGDFADELSDDVALDAADIPSYPVGSVQGHAGKVIAGCIREGNRQSPPLLVFKGRVHFYETGELGSIIFPVRLAKEIGASTLLVTNAAGGVNPQFISGDLMLICDFLSLTFLRIPQIFPHPRGLQLLISRSLPRTDNPFDPRLQELIRTSADKLGITLREGTYCWLKGPSYETAAEIRMLGKIGADAVGMSTVPEIVAAVQQGMSVAGLSLISNLATGLTGDKLSHAEVTETALRVKSDITGLLREVLLQLGESGTGKK